MASNEAIEEQLWIINTFWAENAKLGEPYLYLLDKGYIVNVLGNQDTLDKHDLSYDVSEAFDLYEY